MISGGEGSGVTGAGVGRTSGPGIGIVSGGGWGTVPGTGCGTWNWGMKLLLESSHRRTRARATSTAQGRLWLSFTASLVSLKAFCALPSACFGVPFTCCFGLPTASPALHCTLRRHP